MAARPMTQQEQAIAAANANMDARALIVGSALPMTQVIDKRSTPNPTLGQPFTVPVKPVGLITKFTIECICTITQGAAETQTITQFGPANILSNITLYDLNNLQRISTTGWHLNFLATMRNRNLSDPCVFGAAYTHDSPINCRSNFSVISAPSTFTTGAQTVRMFYEVPVSYSDLDLRGAIYAGVTSATMQLQFTLSSTFWSTLAGDSTLSVYKSSTAQLGVMTNFTYTVYQHFYDQLPQTNQGPLLPLMDLSMIYTLSNTAQVGLVQGQDFPVQYANFRSYQSTFAIFNNGGTLNAGNDVNYWGMQSANLTYLFQWTPSMCALQTRKLMSDDFPLGVYYFDHRVRPVNTNNYGNMQLVVNPSTVNAGATLLLGYEMLALQNQAIQGGSLSAT